MIKFLFVGRRAAGHTRAEALSHLRDIHGRMVVCPPSDAGAMPAYYAQNHVIDGAYPAGGEPYAIERDLVTHLEFESLDAMRAAVDTPYYRENLKPDEPRFVDDATVARLNVVPHRIVEGARTQHKLFVFVSRASDADEMSWNAARATLAVEIAGWKGVAALIENEVMAPPVGRRFVDVVFEVWFDLRESALASAPHATTLFGGDAIDRSASLTIVAEEFTQDRLRSMLNC